MLRFFKSLFSSNRDDALSTSKVFGDRDEPNDAEILATFEKTCFGVLNRKERDAAGYKTLGAPLPSAFIDADPRIDEYRRMTQARESFGVDTFDALPEDERAQLIFRVKALTNQGEEFKRFIDSLSPEKATKAIETQKEYEMKYEKLLQIESDLERWKKDWAKHATTYRKEAKVQLPAEGFAEWLIGQSSDTWHEVVIRTEWTEIDPIPNLLDGIGKIVSHDDCDRATALIFLSKAIVDGLYDESYGYLDTDTAQALMKLVHDRLLNDGYSNRRFGLSQEHKFNVHCLIDPEKGPPWSDWRVPREVLESLEGHPHKPDYVFVGGRPMLSFDTWLSGR